MLELDPDFLHECFYYEAETGVLRWRSRPVEHFATPNAHGVWNAKHAGRPAGSPNSKRRWSTKIKDVLHQNHRIAWALYYGRWPVGQIDHINGNPEDNRIKNLREVSNAENCKNRWRHTRNTSGANGVYYHSRDDIWHASIRENGRQKYLGTFRCRTAALVARRAAERRLGYTERHGEARLLG